MFSNRLILLAAIALMAGPGGLEARAETICVDDDALLGCDGTCWTCPFRHLQDALAVASAGDEIHVACGVYKPDQAESAGVTPGDRTATFQLANGVTIRGGYRGCPGGDCASGDPAERDLEAYETILSGDFNRDDGPARIEDFTACFSGMDVPLETGCEEFDLDEDGDIDGGDFGVFTNANNYGDNSYHVVTANGTDGTAVLDGLTIAAGKADGPAEDDHDKGGGMLNNGGSPTLSNCDFEGNSAEDDAGGTYNSSSSAPTLTECNFNGNYAGDAGGGMKNESSSPELSICTFTGNAAGYGGGLYNRDGSSPTLTSCTFAGNVADYHGGGMRNSSSSNPTLTSCTFNSNSANRNGGGMANSAQSNLSLTNCTFTTNSAGWGGGMHNNSSSPTLADCTFSENAAVHDGGGIHNAWDSSPSMSDCAFSANATSASGGGMFNWHSTPSLTRCSFTENSAAWGGGGMCNGDSRSPTLTECTFTGNSAGGGGGIENFANSTPSLSSCTFNGNSAINAGGGMCNEEGSDAQLSVCTFTENLAAEAGGAIHNWQSAPTLSDCSFMGNLAENGGAVNSDDSNPTLIRCTFTDNMAGGCGAISNWQSSPTVTGCDFAGNAALAYYGGAVCNSGASNPEISACTFTENFAAEGGGGMHNCESDPTLTNCIFKHNLASWGGGVSNDTSSPTLTSCSFAENTADSCGGLANWQSIPSLTDCSFTGNEASLYSGGGMCNEGGSSATLGACTFIANLAEERGGGISNWESSPIVTDCIFTDNSARWSGGMNNDSNSNARLTRCVFAGNNAGDAGGAMSNTNYNDVTLVNCLFVGNVTQYNGGAIDNWNHGDVLATNSAFSGNWSEGASGIANWQSCGEITNCVVWDNTGPDGPGASIQVGGGPTVTYSCLQDDDPDDDWRYPGTGNIDDDPLFTGGPTGEWTEDASYDPEAGQTTFVDDLAGWGDGELVGKFVNPDASQFLQAIIVGNTGTELIVFGDFSLLGQQRVPYIIHDYHLSANSPCINAGSNYAADLPAEDLDGDERIQKCRVDMGPDESPYPGASENCNENPFNDDCDVYEGTSNDWNENHMPDECEADCNENEYPDFLDLLLGTSDDCNDNEMPDECEFYGDCNGNDVQDICDLASGMSFPPFATGLNIPEDIVISEGCYPPGFLVTDAESNAVYHVPWEGGCPKLFAEGLSWPIGAVLAPDEFGGQGDRLFVVNGFGAEIVVVHCAGDWNFFAETGVGFPTGIDYVPLAIGGYAAGKLVVTGYDTLDPSVGKIVLIDSAGNWEKIIDGPALWTPALAPDGFGAFEHNILVGQVNGPNLYALDLDVGDPQDFELTRFAAVPLDEGLRGLRQIAFSPRGWAACLDPMLVNEKALFISVASMMGPGYLPGPGAIMAWDQRGRFVAVMRKGPDGQDIEPRGLRFKFNDLLISDVTYCRGALLRARADGFGLADCNADSIPDACQIDENDCNGNGMPDDCDAIEGGDFTGNGEVDLEDFSAFADCLAGPNRAPTPPQSGCADVCLRAFDFAEDEDVDLDDFSALQQRFGQWFGAAGRGASTPRTGDREDPPKQRETGEPPIVPKIGVVLH